MGKAMLPADTIIQLGRAITVGQYRDFFENATGKTPTGYEFQAWLNTQAGKTLAQALVAFREPLSCKQIEEILSEERFDIISPADKAFILAFDKGIEKLGYDFGGTIGDGYVWGKFMIIYSKTGVKSKKVIARFYIRESGIVLRLFIGDIAKHRTYIESTPPHIKGIFINDHGNCSCNPKKENCRGRKSYTIGGEYFEKCSGVVFEFPAPALENLKDYLLLLEEFYPIKKKSA